MNTEPLDALDEEGLVRKINTINRGLTKHQTQLTVPINCLRCLGDFEITALTSCYIRCAQLGIPSLIDGFICSVAALLAIKLNPSIRNWFVFSHESAETGHKIVLEAMQARALLDLEMRLGEASGAATALPLLKLACALHNNMATFRSAKISNKDH